MELKQIPGVGKVTLQKLNNLNIDSVEDMLFCFPKKYEINSLDNIDNKIIDKTMTLKVEIISKPKLYYIRKKLTKMQFQVMRCNFKFTVSIFNREFLMNVLNSGVEIVITGKFLKNFNAFSASNRIVRNAGKNLCIKLILRLLSLQYGDSIFKHFNNKQSIVR